MKLSERRCCVCGCRADLSQTSAHLVVVRWFCTEHGTAFHSSTEFAEARAASRTLRTLELVNAWVDRERSAVVRELCAA